MKRTTFDVPKMDCPSEERLIRMALQGMSQVKNLSFDLANRRLTIAHEGLAGPILKKLEPLNFGARVSSSDDVVESDSDSVQEIVRDLESDPKEASVLWQLLAINGFMFIVELAVGLFAQSTGLIADSLDMLADAAVYGLSLFAVGKSLLLQRKAARMSGYLQLLLSMGALFEVIRRFLFGSEPLAPYMIGLSIVALIANVTCLLLISKHRTGGVHMKASWIFSTNDVIANLGVITAGVLVYFLRSPYPDLAIGLIISAVVFRGAISILKISGEPNEALP